MWPRTMCCCNTSTVQPWCWPVHLTLAETLQACRELQVTTMSLAPTMIALLLDHPDFKPADLRSVRTIGYGASAMPQTLLQRLLAETDVGLCQSYGMTELSGSVAFLTTEDHRMAAADRPDLLRSVGRPLPTAHIKLVDDAGRPCPVGAPGEILVQAAAVHGTATGMTTQLPHRPWPTAGCTPATSVALTTRAICTSSIAKRT